ncbi:MAG: hypothetical protein IBX55_16990 [Methyloprofundus sp.]|nr:hypothetical protein [Methyloprofundus sp.]
MKILTLLFLVLTLSGCVAMADKKPLNISESDWEVMSDEMKLYAYERQARLDAQRQASVQAQFEHRAPAHVQADAYGDRVQCTLNGESRLAGKWRKTDPFGFVVATGDRVEFNYYTNKHSAYGYATFDGVTVQACGTTNLPSHCVSIAATAHQLDRGGVTQQVTSRDFFRGEMSCSLSGRPSRR